MAVSIKRIKVKKAEITAPKPLPDIEQWAVAWTKSRAEKALCEYLQNRSVTCYLPLVKKRRVHGRHIRFSMVPLFPGYVFFNREAMERPAIFASHKVVKVIFADDSEKLRRELVNISLALDSNQALKSSQFALKGTPVRVVEGPFANLEGEFVRRRGKTVLIIKVTLLSRAVEMEIDEAMVEKL
ncbi:MAG: transcription termination/antitermination NusG family protein [Myxococcota bacterium]|jgi:transcription antitermination factor NusG